MPLDLLLPGDTDHFQCLKYCTVLYNKCVQRNTVLYSTAKPLLATGGLPRRDPGWEGL